MSRGSEVVARATPASWLIGLVVAFCAVLLLKWLALVAVAAVAVFAFVRWACGGWDRVPDEAGDEQRPARSAGPPVTVEEAELPAPRPSSHDDCTWCGLRGGHRDDRGRPVRPRHAHAPA